MSVILLLLEHSANRSLLMDALSPRHDVIAADSADALSSSFDLCILDGLALDRLGERVQARKQAEQPAFLPFLLVTARQDMGLATHHLMKNIDELIITPIETVELHARIEGLMARRRLSLEFHRGLVRASPLAIVVMDRDGNVTEWNPAAERVFGWSEAEVLRQPPPYIQAERKDEFRLSLERVWRGEIVTNVERQGRKKDGSVVDVEVSAAPLRNAKGVVTHVVSLMSNISERVQVKEQVGISEARFRATLYSIGDAVISTDTNGNVVTMNSVAEKLTGWREAEAQGKALEEVFHIVNEKTRRKTENPATRVLREGAVVELANHTLLIARHGAEYPIADAGAPIRDEAGKIVGVVLVFRDQTEQRAAMEALWTARREWQATFDAMLDPVALLAPDGTIQQYNQAFASLFEDVPGLPTAQRCFRLIHKTEDHIPGCPLVRACRSGAREDMELLMGDRTFLVSVDPVKAPSAEIVGFVHIMRDITEQKRAEETLRESEDRYRDLIESSQDLICTHDLQGRLLSINPRPAQLLGYTRDELQRMNLRDILAPNMRDKFGDYLDEIKRCGCARGLMQVRTKSGEHRIWEYRNTLRSEGVKEPIVRGMAHDVTEQKQAEHALRESETLFRKLFEHHAAVKLLIDPETGDIIDANHAAAAFYGWPREQLKQMKIHDINTLSPGEIKVVMEKVQSREGIRFEFRHRLADGSIRDVEVFSGKIEVKGKDLLHSVIHDITERKRAEARLKESEETYRNLFQNAQVGLFRTRISDGKILESNEQLARMFGYDSRESFIGEYATAMNYVDPRTREKMLDVIRKEGALKGFDARFYGKDGRVFWARYSAKIYPDKDWIEGVAEDITERKRVEEEKEKLHEQLQQVRKMEAVGRLAGGVAHDFNNMLGIILGYTEMVLLKATPGTTLHSSLQGIRKAAERSADLTRQLLAFARKQTIDPKVLDLNATIEGMLKMLSRLIGEDIELTWMPQPALWPLKMDPAQVDQVLANLCVNARDAIAGIGKVSIETGNVHIDEAYCASQTGFVPGDYVMLAVSDNGCGMGEEAMKNLFDPFFTTKAPGKGTGLGLATVYGIVKQNNGFINVYSEPGQGTTFKIYLPRHGEGVVEGEAARSEVFPPGRGETVLIVEDEPALLAIGKAMLEALGYTVLGSANPTRALHLAHEHSGAIDLLMTDVIMPEMNGRDLAERLMVEKPGIKCLFMSGYTANVIAHHGVLNEGVHFIQKPFSMKDLGAKVRNALDT
jgi:two-component system cell cycle sensor histidine kinase/response regulator CckA